MLTVPISHRKITFAEASNKCCQILDRLFSKQQIPSTTKRSEKHSAVSKNLLGTASSKNPVNTPLQSHTSRNNGSQLNYRPSSLRLAACQFNYSRHTYIFVYGTQSASRGLKGYLRRASTVDRSFNSWKGMHTANRDEDNANAISKSFLIKK